MKLLGDGWSSCVSVCMCVCGVCECVCGVCECVCVCGVEAPVLGARDFTSRT